MKKIQPKLIMAVLVASCAVAFVALSSPAAEAAPIEPHGQACLEYDEGGTDCSFTTYGQCLETASGIGAECYGTTSHDDANDPRTFGAWNGYRSWRP